MIQLTSTKRTSAKRFLIVLAVAGLASIVLTIIPRPSSAAGASFAPGVPITVSGNDGNYPVVADFNEDGNADIAVTGGQTGKISVVLGQGAGNFGAPVDIAVDDFAAGIAAADFNLDGHVDLIVTNLIANGSVKVLFGNGTGSFPNSATFGAAQQVGHGPFAIATGDFNGDHKPDLVLTNLLDQTYTVIFGDGQGGSIGSASAACGGAGPQAVAVADFNRDGIDDIAISNTLVDNVAIFEGFSGGGTNPLSPASGSPYTSIKEPEGLSVGDFNGDGLPDLASADVGGGTVTVFINDGSGVFGTSDFRVGGGPFSLATLDADLDGKADIVTANPESGDVSLLRGNGDGTFQPFQSLDPNVSHSNPIGIAVGDFNGDGRPDLVTGNHGLQNDSLSVLINTSPVSVNASGTAVNAVEGISLSNTVVAGLSTVPQITARNFTATIDWGDGTAFTSGLIVSNGAGHFSCKGTHTYARAGSYNATVTIHTIVDNSTTIVNSAVTVFDAPLNVAPLLAGLRSDFSGVGGTNTGGAAFSAFNAYKLALGGADNGGAAAPQAKGFRTITWDGVALDGTDFGGNTTVIVPNSVVGIPLNRFQERGIEFDEIYAVAGPASASDPSTFTTVNPGVESQFPAFSPTKTFAMFNDNTIDFHFVLPSNHNTAPIQAVSRGFGAIFLDVEAPNTTSIEYFSGTSSLGKFFVPAGGSGQAEFLGIVFQNPVVTKVHIELGTATLFSFNGTNVTPGPPDNPAGGVDLAVTDDFVYPEPTAVSTGINITATVGAPFTTRVASFTDANPGGQVSDYSAVIDWGDGTTSAGGLTPNGTNQQGTAQDAEVNITQNVNGGFDVTGTHSYRAPGNFIITTALRDSGGSSIAAKSQALVTGTAINGDIQFDVPAITVIEGAGSVSLPVTRTGDTSGPASVDFETSDGTAQQKSDYTINSGTLQFLPGEISKSIKVLVVNDLLVEGNETFFVTLERPTGNFVLGNQSAIQVQIIDDDTVPTTINPIDDPTFFVRQHYLDFLGREPDAPGLAFWVSQITACGGNAACIERNRINVSASFFFSIEFQETGGNVIRTQRVAFGRQSIDPSRRVAYLDFMRAAHQVGAGVVIGQPGAEARLEQNKQAYAQQIENDPAFLARFPVVPGPAYVDALFASAGVVPTDNERNAAISAFGSGGTSGRVAALRSVADSNSVRTAEFNPSFVLTEYYAYLRRNPTDAPDFNDSGFQFWLSKLNFFRGDFVAAEMVKAFLSSIEYRQRFGAP